ncbi:type II CAAX endopeptidase family protein [Kandleria sp.]|uniref:CPBP family intramembrane glutamic endopeptidase n=1 Tax=Kandleria sp. TaxID=2774291 RepID=UPI001B4142D6|nr:type II CAAX endopeptidase family protein [Kandleria sp.]MBP3276967.1 CPBP family intramembrane metalloprotease [Kandleria sp.]
MNTLFKKITDSFMGYTIGTIFQIICGSIIGVIIVSLIVVSYVAFGLNVTNYSNVDVVLSSLPAWVETGASYLSSIGLWVMGLLWFMRKNNRPLYKSIGTYVKGNNIKNFVIGLFVGIVLNGACVLVSLMNKDIVIKYQGFNFIQAFLVLLCVFVQSSGEELICRGYLYQKLLKKYEKPIIAIVGNALLFALLHFSNSGVTILSAINILLAGIVFSLMVYHFDSLWMAMGAHTTWNYLQNIVFGLPNSGIKMRYSIFKLTSARDGIAYTKSFGVEGSLMVTLLFILVIGGVIFLKKNPHTTDIWK